MPLTGFKVVVTLLSKYDSLLTDSSVQSRHKMSPNEACTDMGKRICPGRRAFLKMSVITGTAAILTGVPLLSYVIAPALKKGTGKWIDFGPVEGLKPGEIEMLSYEFMVKDGWSRLLLPMD